MPTMKSKRDRSGSVRHVLVHYELAIGQQWTRIKGSIDATRFGEAGVRRASFLIAGIPMKMLRISACLACLALMNADAGAVELKAGDGNPCEYKLTGEFHPGDSVKILAALPGSGKGNSPVICLNSQGGDFLEALNFASQFGGYTTRVQAGDVCASACAWAFMNGTAYATGLVELSRSISPKAILAFHAPYIESNKNDNDVAGAYDQATSEIGDKLLKLTTSTVAGPGYRNVPIVTPTLLSMALLVPKGKYFVIDTIGKALSNNITVEEISYTPTTRKDIEMICRNALAYAYDDWSDDAEHSYFKAPAEGFAAWRPKKTQDSNDVVLRAEVMFAFRREGSCMINIVHEGDSNGPLRYDITTNPGALEKLSVRGNQGFLESKGFAWPSYAALAPKTLLSKVKPNHGKLYAGVGKGN